MLCPPYIFLPTILLAYCTGTLLSASVTNTTNIIERSAISPEKKVNEITKEERTRLVTLLKEFDLTVTGLGNWREAIITKGGIAVKEIDPGTMESKLVSGLYFAGEILDLDALTGGYNLQIAWSTAYLAGQNA